MSSKKPSPLSSRTLLEQIGLDAESVGSLLDDDDPLESPLESMVQGLIERQRALSERHALRVGDLVCWKPGLRNRRYPREHKPAVVVEVLREPVFDPEQEVGSPYFREPLDIVLGIFVDRGDARGHFICWHFDSRRFQHWSAEVVR